MMKIVSGNSNRPLADAICSYLNLPITKAVVKRFNDMEGAVKWHASVTCVRTRPLVQRSAAGGNEGTTHV